MAVNNTIKMEYDDDLDDSTMVPERDGHCSTGDELLGGTHDPPQPGLMQMKTSMAAFNQQRSVVAKLSRILVERVIKLRLMRLHRYVRHGI